MADESPSTVESSENWDEILSLARTHQYDRYLAATLSPWSARADLIILAAFAGEMRRIPWTVSDPTIGMIRLQWWRDCLTAGASAATGNPLADALNDVVARHQLPSGLLIGHIDAQELELYADLIEDLDRVRLHFIKREGALFQLVARVLGVHGEVPGLDKAACAYGMAKTIAEFAFRQNGRQLLVPRDLALSHGVEPGEVNSGTHNEPELDNVVALLTELSEIALADYRVCQTASRTGERDVISALLPTTLTPNYARSAKSPFDAANLSNMGPGNFVKSWRMFLAYLRGAI